MVKKIILCFVVILVLTGQAQANLKNIHKIAKSISNEIIKSTSVSGASVAVLPFENLQGEVTELGRILSDEIIHEILKTKQFTVLDRNYMTRALGEIKLGALGFLDPKTSAQLGKLSGAKLLLVGSLKSYGENKLIVQARLLNTGEGMIITSFEKIIKFDKEMKELFSIKAALDHVVGSLISETKLSDAVFLNQVDESGCRWVQSSANVQVKDNQTVARASAISICRYKSVVKVTGKNTLQLQDLSDEAFYDKLEFILRASKNGRIIKEKIIEEEVSNKGYYVVLQDCVLPLKEGSDKDFHVEVILNQNRFIEGQKARAIVISNRDAYIYLFSVDFENNLSIVFPVQGASDNKILSGKPFIFPNDEHEKAQIQIEARLPQGAKTSIETLRAVATKLPIENNLQEIKTYQDLILKLEESGNEWTEDIKIFTIYKQ